MPELPIYLDYHATTPVDPRVAGAMVPYFTERFGNASSRHHAFGWAARDAVSAARRQIAGLIGADAREICFTSGATESNNLAVRGIVNADSRRPLHVVTMTTEHHAVLDPCRRLEREGVEVTYVAPRPDGLCDVADIERALLPHTRLVSIMAANNEIGVLQPIARIAELTRPRGIVLHTDAAQAVGKVPVDVEALGVDLLSATAHKLYGPKGIGVLYVRRRRPRLAIEPLLEGGPRAGPALRHPERPRHRGLRARRPESAGPSCTRRRERVGALRDRLLAGLTEGAGGVTVNGSTTARLPHNLNVSLDRLEGESLLVGLDDIAVSSGAACTSVNPEPSHVLRAIGVPDELARASLRFGLGRWTTTDEIDYAIEKVGSLAGRLRQLSAVGQAP